MGQCYSTFLKVRFEDEQGAIKAVQNLLTDNDEYTLEDYSKHTGLDYNTIDGCLRHFYANWEDGYKWTPTTDPDVLSGDFNAPYSWEIKMVDVFYELAPFLKDGSSLKIYPDSDYDHLVVWDGQVSWIH